MQGKRRRMFGNCRFAAQKCAMKSSHATFGVGEPVHRTGVRPFACSKPAVERGRHAHHSADGAAHPRGILLDGTSTPRDGPRRHDGGRLSWKDPVRHHAEALASSITPVRKTSRNVIENGAPQLPASHSPVSPPHRAAGNHPRTDTGQSPQAAWCEGRREPTVAASTWHASAPVRTSRPQEPCTA
jgi:hypothetical protein